MVAEGGGATIFYVYPNIYMVISIVLMLTNDVWWFFGILISIYGVFCHGSESISGFIFLVQYV